MKLRLLSIDDFIEKNEIQRVSSIKHYKGRGRDEFNPSGLFSEEIFGRVGSKERRRKFGYIELNTNLIHPEAYPILTSINPNITKLILEKENYIIQDGELIQDDENGYTGLYYFIQNFNELDFNKIKTEKPNNIRFIENNKDKILIDKYLVLPAGIRDIKIDQRTHKTIIQYSEITDLYVKLLRQTNNILIGVDDIELMTPTIRLIQRTLIEINEWIKNRMKGKHGLMRGGMLKKVTDYSGRLVITPDTNLQLGYVGLPWHYVLKLHEPFAIHYIYDKDKNGKGLEIVKKFLNLREDPDIEDIRRTIGKINDAPRKVPAEYEEYFREVANEISKDKVVAYKRDPVENRDSWLSAYIRVDDSGYTMKLNPYDLKKNGGDFDGDQCSVFALLTEEAQQEAKEKLNPIHSKGVWVNAQTLSKTAYSLEHDAAMAVYSATKDPD
ncbi:MAG: hypothetical protein ACOC1O_02040 [bacterium]